MKDKNKRETKKDKIKRGGGQQKATEKQRETQKKTKMPFFGGKMFFY